METNAMSAQPDGELAAPNGWYPLEHVRLAGVWVAIASRDELVKAARHDAGLPAEGRRARLIFDANGHGVSMAASDKAFGQILAQGDVVHADGGFLISASRLLSGRRVAERSATTDMIHDFARAPGRGLSFYLLGATEEVNAKACEILRETYPNLRIVGRRNGYFRREEEEAVVADINRTQPDVLWVGLGKPLEQAFCLRHRDTLNAAWVVTCGGCYNYITGDYDRAPQWMQDGNLEWLHRMATRPKQLFWRYLTTTPHAFWLAATRSGGQVTVRGGV